MEIALCIGYTLIFSFLIFKLPFFRIDNVSRKILFSLFIIKIISAFALTFIYTYYYDNRTESDIFKYFDDGKAIFSSIHNNPVDYLRMITGIGSDAPHLEQYYKIANFWYKEFDYNLYNDNRTIIRFNAIVMLFSFGYFNVHNIFMAFISFTGLTAIFKVFYPYFIQKRNALLFSIFLIPSVLLWTSGVLKEGILMFALGFLVYYVNKLLFKKFSTKYLILLILVIALLFLSKFYVLLAAIPGLLCIVTLRFFKKLPSLPIVAGIHILIISVFFFFHFIFPKYNLAEIASTKQHDFINMINLSPNVGSRIDLPVLEPTFQSFIKNTPTAFVNSFFRPHVFEIKSAMVIPAAMENLLIVTILILSIIFYKKPDIKNFTWFWFCLSFVFILFILCGLTTPVLGALVRYRTPALPFLFIIFLTIIDLNRIAILFNKIITPFVKWKK
ncbi:MAG: hypothetical protein HY951_08405 [Bacteroidia bacterium]|nr:hypothetical protein [Bacteroidia bacterium]